MEKNVYVQFCMLGSYIFLEVKFKHFSSTFKAHFHIFPAPYRRGKIHIYWNIYILKLIFLHFLSQLCTFHYAENI